jgi:hypothetical protein
MANHPGESMKYLLNRADYGHRATEPEGDTKLGMAPTAATI